jgi:hypothetical protein
MVRPELIEQVATALLEELKKVGYGVGTINAGQLSDALAPAAIDAVRSYLKEHDDGFQCQECNGMVDVDAAFLVTK